MDNSTNERSYEPHVVQRIEPLLERYFAGEVETNGSNFGQMIERMKTYGFAAMPCMAAGCHSGFMDDGTDCKRCKGTGFRSDSYNNKGELVDYGAVRINGRPERDLCSAGCPDCKGAGKVEFEPSSTGVVKLTKAERARLCGLLYQAGKRISYRTIKRVYAGRMASKRAHECIVDGAVHLKLPAPPTLNTNPIKMVKCQLCNGCGSIVPIDAMNGTQGRTEGGYRMREDEMEFQATVNRVVRQLMVNSQLAYYVLSAYHGTIGDHWATFDAGRIFALWPLTIPGRELVESGSKKIRNPHDRLLEQTQQQTKDPQTHRATLIRQAGEAARSLLKTSHKELAIADRATGGRLESLAMRKGQKRTTETVAVAV